MPDEPHWVDVGREAQALVTHGSVAALLYWVDEITAPGGDFDWSGAPDWFAGFCWFGVDRPQDHVFLFECEEATEEEWERARVAVSHGRHEEAAE